MLDGLLVGSVPRMIGIYFEYGAGIRKGVRVQTFLFPAYCVHIY